MCDHCDKHQAWAWCVFGCAAIAGIVCLAVL